MRSLIVCLLVAIAQPALAINKCVDAKGHVTYTSEPCSAGSKSVGITGSISGPVPQYKTNTPGLNRPRLRPGERSLLKQIQIKEHYQRRRAAYNRRKAAINDKYDREIKRLNRENCTRARAGRDRYRDYKRNGYTASQGVHYDRAIEGYENSMRKYCR